MVTAVDKNHVLLTSWSRVGASEVSISVCPQSPHAISFPIPGYSTSRANGPHAPLTRVTVVFPEPHFAQVVVSDMAQIRLRQYSIIPRRERTTSVILLSSSAMTCAATYALEPCCSIQHNEHAEQTERKQANYEHQGGGVARQAGVNVGEPTALADFTTGTNGFHHDDVLAHAARAVADFIHAPNPTSLFIIVILVKKG